MENRSLFGLDLIRFVAAAMVAWFHLAYFNWAGRTAPPPPGAVYFPELAPLASFGWVGVEVFFVLSGFVIAYSAEGKSAWDFAKSRFLRLYPAVWICATISLIALSLSQRELLDPYLRSIALWPVGPWVDGVYWTLGVEMAFYGLVFLLLLAKRSNHLGGLLVTIGLVSSAFWGTWLVDHLLGGSSLTWTFGHRYFELSLVQHGCFFALGGMIWLILFKPSSHLHLVIATLSAAAGLTCIYAIAHLKVVTGQGHNPLAPTLVWLAAVGLIIAAVVYRTKLTRFSGVSSRKLGLATYPLYLLHHILGVTFMRQMVLSGVAQGLALVVALFIVSVLSVLVLYPEAFLRSCVGRVWDLVQLRGKLLLLSSVRPIK